MHGFIDRSGARRPGETALWHIANQSANLAVHLASAGHKFTIVAHDGNLVPNPVEVDMLDIDPASRFDALVTGGRGGTYDLVARNVLTGQRTAMTRDRTIGHVAVSGSSRSCSRNPRTPRRSS